MGREQQIAGSALRNILEEISEFASEDKETKKRRVKITEKFKSIIVGYGETESVGIGGRGVTPMIAIPIPPKGELLPIRIVELKKPAILKGESYGEMAPMLHAGFAIESAGYHLFKIDEEGNTTNWKDEPATPAQESTILSIVLPGIETELINPKK